MFSKNQWVIEEKKENSCVLMYGTGKQFLDIYSIDNEISIVFTYIPTTYGSFAVPSVMFIPICVSLHDFTFIEQYNPKFLQIRSKPTDNIQKLSQYIEAITEDFPEVQDMKYALLDAFHKNSPKKMLDQYGDWDLLREVRYASGNIKYTHNDISIEISTISENSHLVELTFTPLAFKKIKPSLISSTLVNSKNPKFCFRCETPEIREKLRQTIEEIDKHYPLYGKKHEIFKGCNIESFDVSSEFEDSGSEEIIQSTPMRRNSY